MPRSASPKQLPPFKCPDCPEEFPSYQARFYHQVKEHGLTPKKPGQYTKRKGMGSLRCTELVGGKKCGKRYTRPQDLGKHKWFAHGIRGSKRPGTHSVNENGRANHVENTAPTFTQDDLQFEGIAAFTAGEVYEKIRQRAEAAELPYGTLAERVYGFVRATTGGPKLGHPNRVPLLPDKTAA